MTPQLHVEGWAPEYGASVETLDDLTPSEGSVDIAVEDRPWAPIDGNDDGVPVVAFVDGVRRVDARLILDDPAGPIPGICGSYGVGAVLWHRSEHRSETVDVTIGRLAVLANGRHADIPPAGHALSYRTESVADDDPAALVRHFHGAMRLAEARLAEDLARGGYFVIADGPLYETSATHKVGYIKSHRVAYLPEPHGVIIGALGSGQRTPLFTIKGYERYSWYVRIAPRGTGHSWSGIVRCEAPAALERDTVVGIADRTASLLPGVASEPHLDPRAPQNLVPIAALERDLRHRLGDPGLVLRALRSAVGRRAA